MLLDHWAPQHLIFSCQDFSISSILMRRWIQIINSRRFELIETRVIHEPLYVYHHIWKPKLLFRLIKDAFKAFQDGEIGLKRQISRFCELFFRISRYNYGLVWIFRWEYTSDIDSNIWLRVLVWERSLTQWHWKGFSMNSNLNIRETSPNLISGAFNWKGLIWSVMFMAISLPLRYKTHLYTHSTLPA